MQADVSDRLIIDSIRFDSLHSYGLYMVDFSEESPKPKTYTVDVPGRSGVIDLTEALSGDVAYSQGKHVMQLVHVQQDFSDPDDNYVWDESLWNDVKTKVKAELHGKRFEYKLSFDPEYTYNGRFSVDFGDTDFAQPYGVITVEVTRDPYKLKEKSVYKLNANGGNVYRFESGRRPVQPTFECSNPTIIEFEGKTILLPQGSYKCPDVVFTEGWNEVYINSMVINTLTWDELDELQMTWNEADTYRWFELEKLGMSSDVTGLVWDEAREYRWSELESKAWDDVVYVDAGGRAFTTYVSYEWSDL